MRDGKIFYSQEDSLVPSKVICYFIPFHVYKDPEEAGGEGKVHILVLGSGEQAMIRS